MNIKISKATDKEALSEEWQAFTYLHYGQGAKWVENNYRFKAVEGEKIVGRGNMSRVLFILLR